MSILLVCSRAGSTLHPTELDSSHWERLPAGMQWSGINDAGKTPALPVAASALPEMPAAT